MSDDKCTGTEPTGIEAYEQYQTSMKRSEESALEVDPVKSRDSGSS